VFAVDQVTGRLLQRTFQDGWRNWVDRGLGPAGHRLSAPAAVSWDSGRIDVLARDEVTDALIHFWQSGTTWHGPQRLASGPGGDYSPSVASWAPRRLDVFAVTSAGSLAQFWFDGSRWHGWSAKGRGPGGAALIQPAAVASWGPGQMYYNGSWHGPIRLDFNTSTVVGTATIMADPNPRSTPIPVSEEARAAD
jgi:hypothetical protein